MIVFAAFVPHTPLLLASVNKEQLTKVQKTRDAMTRLAEELYTLRPDTLLVLSSHGTNTEQAFSLNLHQEYEVDFREFGDLSNYRSFLPDLSLMDHLQRHLRQKQVPFTMNSHEKLAYDLAVPLLCLTEHLPKIRIVPMATSHLTPKEHFQFGQQVKEVLVNEPKRIALIVTGDLSHTLTSYSPGGLSKEGAQFDALMQEHVTNSNPAGLLAMNQQIVENAKQCAYLPMLTLLGMLEKIHNRPMIHSYEAPFGVGYLVAHFHLS